MDAGPEFGGGEDWVDEGGLDEVGADGVWELGGGVLDGEELCARRPAAQNRSETKSQRRIGIFYCDYSTSAGGLGRLLSGLSLVEEKSI
jgi:hypothetical protein